MKEVLDYIYGLSRMGAKPRLEPIKKALRVFNNPQKGMKIIHIAGTNGKGSVTAMISSILREAGCSVGMYTSPHLVDYRERIQFNGRKISKKDFLSLFYKIKKKNFNISFFEFTTLLALLYFAEKKPDYVVLEVGLGGRLDPTNAIKPIISAITDISLDHEKFLGNNLSSITKEKCGIIKPGIPVITSNDSFGIVKIIKKVCSKHNSPFIFTPFYEGKLSLKGDFQKRNAGIAVEIAKRLKIKEKHIKKGLKKTKWPGRIQYISKNIIFDGAHNPAGIKALAEYISSLKYRNLIVVFGVKESKEYGKMLNLLPEYKHLIITRAETAKALDPDKIKRKCLKIPDYIKALNKARSLAKKQDLVLVTGSLYLIGDILAKLKK